MLVNELKQHLGEKGLMFLKNNFRFEVKFLDCDNEFLKVIDLKNLTVRFYRISEIASIEVLENG